MKKIRTPNLLIMGIGLLSIIAGIYLAITGSEFQDYFSGIFIGGTLIGAAYINNQKSVKKE